MGNQTILRRFYLNTLMRTLKYTSQLTRVQIVKIICQESKSIHPPKLVKRYIDSDFNTDQLITRINFLVHDIVLHLNVSLQVTQVLKVELFMAGTNNCKEEHLSM